MKLIKGGENENYGIGIEVGVDVGIGDDGEAINPRTQFMCITLAKRCSERCSQVSCNAPDGIVIICFGDKE